VNRVPIVEVGEADAPVLSGEVLAGVERRRGERMRDDGINEGGEFNRT
jgi:hypothetical protein